MLFVSDDGMLHCGILLGEEFGVCYELRKGQWTFAMEGYKGDWPVMA